MQRGKPLLVFGHWTHVGSGIALGLERYRIYERHYRGWLDEPLPALDGRTPREAASLQSARPKVIALLKDMENLSARERLEGRPAYDFGWMWGQLGLERSG